MLRRSLCAILLAAAALPLQAQWVGGAEAGGRRTYFYLTRYTPVLQLHDGTVYLWTTGSYLRYDLAGGAEVSSPGLSGGATYRRQGESFDVGAGAGYETRWTTRTSEGASSRQTENGIVLLGDATWRISERLDVAAAANWSGANEWLGSRGTLLYDVAPALRVGPEAGLHGNDELRVTEIGGVAAIRLGESWIQLRGGRARSRERNGFEQTEPYFSVGVARQF